MKKKKIQYITYKNGVVEHKTLKYKIYIVRYYKEKKKRDYLQDVLKGRSIFTQEVFF